MALTKVSRGLLSTSIVDNGNATAITIDSSENVGIGTGSPSTKLHLGGTAPLDSIIRQDSTVSGTNWEIGERAAGKWQIWEDDSDSVVATFMSSGNVGIKETAPFGKLHISDTQTGRTVADSVGNLLVLEDDENGMSILSSNAGAGYILFGDAASAASGGIVYDHSANKFNFRTNDAWNRMILDASGNLLVGKTASDGGVAGHELRAGSFAIHTRDNGPSLYARRIGAGANDDGPIQVFQNADGEVGSIGTANGDLNINGPAGHSGIRFQASSILPRYDGADTDGTMDIGYNDGTATHRWRDLYLSGGVYLGGTGAANKLDDYEEGTWTPFLDASSTDPSLSYSTQVGAYEKIGALVHASFFINVSAVNSQGSGTLRIAGLPFNASSSVNASEVPAVLLQTEPFNAGDGAGYQQYARTQSNSNVLLMGYKTGTGSASIPSGASHVGTGYLIGHIVYRTLS